ncbi:MAG: homocysteine S-methyltransferase family protein [Candidatus Omnitrophica bacterium]|nr:homocysteine S-methyltransferase family protein [Candidatus Omnitrophota bacterium]
MNKPKIRELLKKRIVLLDGATGTELYKRGMPAGACPESWCLENPGVIKSLHADYLAAGSDIVYACTFTANRKKLSYYKIKDVVSLNQRLVLLARQAVGNRALVAGDIAGTGEFIKPFGSLDFEQAVDIYKEQVKGLLLGGVDLFVIETMIDIQEARAALIAVKELSDKFTIVTMTYEKAGRTLNGNDPLSALITLQSLGADAVGANCSTGPEDMYKIISKIKPYATVPLVAKPNAGMPELVNNKAVFNLKPAEFSSAAKKLASLGVNLIGGCCGTTPEHIAYLKRKLLTVRPLAPKVEAVSALSSARGAFIFTKQKIPLIIGEKINPTGKKDFQRQLAKGDFSSVLRLAKEQESQGAGVLDLNLGVGGSDEKKLILAAISLLSVSTALPLVIDSANPEVIEEALRFYPGRALINSISGEKKRLKKLLGLAKKYGAMFIILPLTGKKIPATFQERKKIIKMIFKEAVKAGFSKDDFLVDGLVMPLSWSSKAALITLEVIGWCSKQLKVKTVAGLSNVSFGLPRRGMVNRVFLKMAKACGLTAAIANPQDKQPLSNRLAENLLSGKDKDSHKFISVYSRARGDVKNAAKSRGKVRVFSPGEQAYQAIVEGNRSQINSLIDKALSSKLKAQELLEKNMIPAMVAVGEFFQARQYFLPQLIASAETMQRGVFHLQPYLKKKTASRFKKGVILLATVKGDIHDIGKNIVALVLKNYGFEVIDLGKDISVEKIIAKAKSHSPDIVGLSALMTTTMVQMPLVISAAKKEGLGCKFMVGGAVVNKTYADSIGAEYAKDSIAAVKVAEKIGRRRRRP